MTLREKSHASIINFSILPALIPMPHAAEQGAPRKKNTIFVPNIPTMFRISTRLHAPSFPHPYFLKMPHANPPLGPLPHRQREDEPPNTASLPHPSPPTPSPEPTAAKGQSWTPARPSLALPRALPPVVVSSSYRISLVSLTSPRLARFPFPAKPRARSLATDQLTRRTAGLGPTAEHDTERQQLLKPPVFVYRARLVGDSDA